MHTKTDVHYLNKIQTCPGLYFAAGSWNIDGRTINGTGVGTCKEGAVDRCLAERAETIALYRSKEVAKISSMSCHSTYGTAAAATYDLALQRAKCEAVERLAVHQWWAGMRPPSLPAPETLKYARAKAVDWGRNAERGFQLIELPLDDYHSIHVAWSENSLRKEILIGASCNTEACLAAEAALKELVQMECGLEIIKIRRNAGVKLGSKELMILSRAENLFSTDCRSLLIPIPGSVEIRNKVDNMPIYRSNCLQNTENFSLNQLELPGDDDRHKVAFVSLKSRPPANKESNKEENIAKSPWLSWKPY